MRLDQIDLQQAELNDLLDAYERARAVEGDVDLRECLPRPGHPLYLEARRELVRLDLEHSWQNQFPKRLAVYVALFPDLLADEQSANDITFEEYRLRVLAGENPSAAEYETLYGVNSSQWPGSDAELAAYPGTVVAEDVVVDVGEENADTVVNRMATPPLEWDMFGGADVESHQSLSGETAQALLRQNASHSNAEVSFLLAQALTSLPDVGTRFLNFHLIAELGRGSFGCVYLARQSGLANRLVALKLTVDLQGEEQKLAQLQHTNVVPRLLGSQDQVDARRLHALFRAHDACRRDLCFREQGRRRQRARSWSKRCGHAWRSFRLQTDNRAATSAMGGATAAAAEMAREHQLQMPSCGSPNRSPKA